MLHLILPTCLSLFLVLTHNASQHCDAIRASSLPSNSNPYSFLLFADSLHFISLSPFTSRHFSPLFMSLFFLPTQFLQRPYTPSGSGRFAYPHDNMNGSSLQMRQSRSKSNTHPDYEQYESLSYAHERANVRDSQGMEENDTSFISDSQLIRVNERKKLDTEMSMASESLLMYVGGGAQRLKERFAKKASKDKADESPQVCVHSMTCHFPRYRPVGRNRH